MKKIESAYIPPEIVKREDLEKIGGIISEIKPFGKGKTQKPTIRSGTSEIIKEARESTIRYVYAQNKSFDEAALPHYRIITGRKGAGKTSFLKALLISEYYEIQIIVPHEDLRKWVRATIKGYEDVEISVDEYIEEFEYFYWILVFRRLARLPEFNNIEKIKKFLVESNLHEGSIMDGIAKSLAEHQSNKSAIVGVTSGVISALIDAKRTSFQDALKEAHGVLLGKKVVILIDNPEVLEIQTEKSKKIFQALIFSAATFQPVQAQIIVKYFIQAERYQQLKKNSISWGVVEPTIKALRWTPEELLILLAKRIRVFKFLTNRIDKDEITLQDLDDVNNAIKEWYSFFPDTVRNRALQCNENS